MSFCMSHFDLAGQFKLLAETSVTNNLPGKAFAFFCLSLEANPELSTSLKTPFAINLCNWGKILEHEEKYGELFTAYEKALQLYPDNEIILNNLGAHLCRLQQPREALKYFTRAVEINNNYLPAYINREVTKSILVERWHFRMLNDSIRNESYRKAIQKRVNGCGSILDIGSGTGILSIYAKAAGADKVYCCDYSETMVSISSQVLQKNGLSDSIKVINKLSTDLSIPDDIPERLAFIVTETFDGGLLGEHILETLIHAWENLLQPPSSEFGERVIPNGAILYIVPIECIQIARKNYILKSNRIERSSFSSGIDLSDVHSSSKMDEPYDTENLKALDCSYIAAPQKLFEFNFNSLSNLKKYYDGEIINKITFHFEKEGYIDAFAVWFELILDDNIIITSSPLCEKRCCWEQAIFPLKEEMYANKNSNITIQASCRNGILSINPKNKINKTEKCIENSQSVISMLNCESFLLKYLSTFEEIQRVLGTRLISVLDLSVCPYLGVLIAKKMNSKVYFSNHNIDAQKGIKDLLENFKIDQSRSFSLEWIDILNQVEERNQAFDVIIVDVLDSSGQMNEEMVGLIPLLRELLSAEGLFIPSKLQIWCQVVYSEELMNSSEVRSSGDHLHIAEYVNDYKVAQMMDFNLHDTNYIEASDYFMIGCIEMKDAPNEIVFKKELKVFKNSQANAIIYWFSLCFFDTVDFSTFSKDSHINHSAALMDEPINLQELSTLTIKLQYNSGAMRFSVS